MNMPLVMHTTPTSEIERLRVKAARVEELEADLEALRRGFAAYKARVRELAIETADSEGWCAEGLNRGLRELDLEPRMYRYQVEVEVSGRQTITVTVEAEDEDDAEDKAGDLDEDDYRHLLDRHNWTLDVEETLGAELVGEV